MKIFKYINYSTLWWAYYIIFFYKINALSECTMQSNICTIKKGQNLLDKNKYCISENKIYYGNNNSGGCSLATLITSNGNYFFKNDEIITNADINPDSGFYCTNNNNCIKINENGIYINKLSPMNIVSYVQNGLSQSIAISVKCAFLTNISSPYLIECDLKNGCSEKYSFSKNNVYINGLGNGLKNALIICSSSTECNVITPNANTQYISSTDEGGLITCTNNGCTSINYDLVIPNTYYLNYGNDKDTKPLIYCDSSSLSCKSIKGIENYLINGADKSTLIYCSKDPETLNISCSIENNKTNVFFLNAAVKNSKTDALIKCNSEECIYFTPIAGYYLNGNVSSLENSLILCNTYCSIEKSKNDLFYINGARDGLKNGLIYCSHDKLCYSLNASADSFYLSGIMNGLEDALIYFDKNSYSSILDGISNSFYLNAASTNSTNALISCDDDVCLTSKEINDSYYITKSYESSTSNKEIFKSLVYCNVKGSCRNVNADKDSYYLNRAAVDLNDALIKCEIVSSVLNCAYMQSSKINPGYYLNSSEKSSIYPLITCNNDKCTTLTIKNDVTPGYYINAGDSVNPIIICDENCYSTKTLNFQKVGGYNYKNPVLNFYYNDTTTVANTTSISIDLYYNVKITENNVFPSIGAGKETIFKISKYSITRVAVDSILSIGSDNKLRTNEIKLGNSSEVYSCTKSTQTCTKITSCITNSFYLDKISSIGYYCDSNQLSPITKAGYYINSSVYVGNNTPSLIYCNVLGKCINVDDPLQYYLNAGINYHPNSQSNFSSSVKKEKKLIYCNGINCNTLISSNGYYVAGLSPVDIVENRLIYCSDDICNEPRPISIMSYFINSGIDNTIKPIILCDTNQCYTKSINSGYFLTEKENTLIYCDSSSCKESKAVAGYYYYGGSQSQNKYLIKCISQPVSGIECQLINGQTGFYVSTTTNVLINCSSEQCKTLLSKNGLFRSATTRKSSSLSKRNNLRFSTRASNDVYNLIICNSDECHELSTLELAQIPICSFNDDKCYIDLPSSSTLGQVTSISPGGYCTNSDRSQIYFATDSIIIKSDEIDSTFSTASTTKNCLKVGKNYNNNYFVYQNIIYKLNENCITQISNTGYYFINTLTNSLASPNDISTYNNINTKLYKCDEDGCSTVNKPNKIAYFADVNKKIIKYDETCDCYSFMRDIICIYSNYKCTPNSDMNGQNVCITYKGELIITSSAIQSHESGTCYKSNDINSNIYAFSQSLYSMDSNSAFLIQTTSYIFINNVSHTNASYRDIVNGKANSISIYGCIMSNCHHYEPEEGIYYYNTIGNYLVKYENGIWTTPKKSGYALVSINPNELYIYKFSIVSDKSILENKVSEGFYYTIDEEMYICTDQNSTCEKISESGYYFTASDEMYYCLYDSEHIEKTVCYKQNCITGQYYFIEYRYHRCEKGSILHPVSINYCNRFNKVIINFPTMYKKDIPSQIRKAIDNIEEHNNSTSVIKSNNINVMNVVPGIFTNCTYNHEDDTSNFDLICISNFVQVDKNKDAKICSIENLGYIECEEDSQNPEKCHASFALSHFHQIKLIYTIIINLVTYLLLINIL